MSAHIHGQPHDRAALIAYGSETGNSQEAAEQLGRITDRLCFVTEVVEINAVDLKEILNYKLVIFTISTTGQGDIPANAIKFWKSLLRKRLSPDCLVRLRFTTFGFGDSSYPKYNWAARKLHKRLEQLGAQEIHPRGEADEQHPEGSDAAFLPWSLELRARLLEKFPLPEGAFPIPDTELLPPKWTLELSENVQPVTSSKETSGLSSLSPSEYIQVMDGPITKDLCVNEPISKREMDSIDIDRPPEELLPIPMSWTATIDQNIRITPLDHWQDVRHISMYIHTKLDYRPGDIITIYPKNFPEDVENLIKLMNWTADADRPITFHASKTSYIENNFSPNVFNLNVNPNPTLRSLLLNNLDITAIPRRFFFEICAKFATDPMHKERLLEFCNPAYTDEFFDYATRPRRSMIEILHDFTSVKLPWRWAPYIFPILRGRQFSLSSGGQFKHPCSEQTRMDICVALVRYRTVLKKIRQGVCSRYLATLAQGTKINVTFSRGSFKVTPLQAKRPIVMIAPGTGVAPMRSLIWERALWRETGELRDAGEAVLLFGGRSHKKDFLYSSDWRIKEVDLKVLTAWSRDQKEKIYVQDKVREHAPLMWRLLVLEEGSVFICGSSGKMPVAVRAALVDAFVAEGKKLDPEYTKEKAEELLSQMEKERRYIQETW